MDKSSSLNNLQKKQKSNIRQKEVNSRLSEKAKVKASTTIKKSKEIKRGDSDTLNDE